MKTKDEKTTQIDRGVYYDLLSYILSFLPDKEVVVISSYGESRLFYKGVNEKEDYYNTKGRIELPTNYKINNDMYFLRKKIEDILKTK